MAVSLNLTVGILGELSLGHAGFMSVGAFSGIVASQSSAWARSRTLPCASPSRWSSARVFAAIVGLHHRHSGAAPAGRLPRHRHAGLRRDHQETSSTASSSATMKTACTSIFNAAGTQDRSTTSASVHSGTAIIKGAQGATGTATIATFTAGFVLVMVTLVRRSEPRQLAAPAARSWPSATTASPPSPSAST